MAPSFALHQLYIIRNQVELAIASLEADAAISAPPEPVGCEHPSESRVPSNNMGEEPQFWCRACKTFVAGAV
jgi:hypothetical protein